MTNWQLTTIKQINNTFNQFTNIRLEHNLQGAILATKEEQMTMRIQMDNSTTAKISNTHKSFKSKSCCSLLSRSSHLLAKWIGLSYINSRKIYILSPSTSYLFPLACYAEATIVNCLRSTQLFPITFRTKRNMSAYQNGQQSKLTTRQYNSRTTNAIRPQLQKRPKTENGDWTTTT